MEKESMEVVVARIDERVEAIHDVMPGILKDIEAHDRAIWVGKTTAKVIGFLMVVVMVVRFPPLGDLIARILP